MVELRGAIVTRSKNVKTAIEIETGALVSTKGIEKRTYIFTPEIEEKGMKKDMDEVCVFVCVRGHGALCYQYAHGCGRQRLLMHARAGREEEMASRGGKEVHRKVAGTLCYGLGCGA